MGVFDDLGALFVQPSQTWPSRQIAASLAALDAALARYVAALDARVDPGFEIQRGRWQAYAEEALAMGRADLALEAARRAEDAAMAAEHEAEAEDHRQKWLTQLKRAKALLEAHHTPGVEAAEPLELQALKPFEKPIPKAEEAERLQAIETALKAEPRTLAWPAQNALLEFTQAIDQVQVADLEDEAETHDLEALLEDDAPLQDLIDEAATRDLADALENDTDLKSLLKSANPLILPNA